MGHREVGFFSNLLKPCTLLVIFLSYVYLGGSCAPAVDRGGRCDRRKTLEPIHKVDDPTMMPILSEEMLLTTLETMCYFCTAVGVALTLMFSSRR